LVFLIVHTYALLHFVLLAGKIGAFHLELSAAGLFVARVGAGIPAFEIYSTMTCPYIHGCGAQM